MTRTYHDLFAKQHLEALLEPVGTVTTSRKVISETREMVAVDGSWEGSTSGEAQARRKLFAELLALPVNHPMRQNTIEHLAVLRINLNVGQKRMRGLYR
jgi:ribosome biogenesis protein Tsr3